MQKLTITTKSAAQIDADFEAAFRNIQPAADAKPVTQADRLAPYRKVILKQRRRGLTWKQIADAMCQPPIGETVSETMLRRVFNTRKTGARRPASAASTHAVPFTLKPSAGAAMNLLNGPAAAPQAVPVAAPACRPMTAKEEDRFAPLLKGLIPAIVKTKMSRSDARSYAENAVELFRPAEAERFQEVLAAELDALNETTCARYAVAAELIAPWKRRWM